MPTRRLTDPPMLWLKHCFRYVTHPSRQTYRPQLRSSMDIQLKVLFFQDHPGRSIYARSARDLSSCKRNRKNSSTEPIGARDLRPLKVKEQVQFFQNKQATGPIKWTTGTVTEILDCGRSYTIQGPNGRLYRRNRAHLKPICHDGTSFQDHRVRKGEKQLKDSSFQDHYGHFKTMQQARFVSFNNKVKYIGEADYMDTRSMMFDGPETRRTPPPSPATSPPRRHSPRSPSFSPPASLPSRESSVEPSSEDSSPEGRQRH